MSSKKVILIGGGARSGKSSFALSLARSLGKRRLFIATARAGDEEMRERIARHRLTRGGDFHTIEEPLLVPEAIEDARDCDVVVVDCLTLWMANLLLEQSDVEAVTRRVEYLSSALAGRTFHAIIVTNEVGLGIVPESPLGRAFRDLAGIAHQRLSRQADEVYFAVLGTMLRLKPEPAFVNVKESTG